MNQEYGIVCFDGSLTISKDKSDLEFKLVLACSLERTYCSVCLQPDQRKLLDFIEFYRFEKDGIRGEFPPPNCISWKQPCDQRIINELKTR
jgi:hypothetical protein